MKSALVIGLGRFGRHLARKLTSLGCEVMIADQDERKATQLADEVTDAVICDCTEEDALHALGIRNFDLCFVCIGSDFKSSLLITSMLRDAGAKHVVSKARDGMHARLLLKNGADEVVYPEQDSAERVAMRTGAQNVFDYIELTAQHAIYEIPVLREWIGKSVGEIDIRNQYRINILAVKSGSVLRPLPGAGYVFCGSEHLLALSAKEDIRVLLRKIESFSPFR